MIGSLPSDSELVLFVDVDLLRQSSALRQAWDVLGQDPAMQQTLADPACARTTKMHHLVLGGRITPVEFFGWLTGVRRDDFVACTKLAASIPGTANDEPQAEIVVDGDVVRQVKGGRENSWLWVDPTHMVMGVRGSGQVSEAELREVAARARAPRAPFSQDLVAALEQVDQSAAVWFALGSPTLRQQQIVSMAGSFVATDELTLVAHIELTSESLAAMSEPQLRHYIDQFRNMGFVNDVELTRKGTTLSLNARATSAEIQAFISMVSSIMPMQKLLAP